MCMFLTLEPLNVIYGCTKKCTWSAMTRVVGIALYNSSPNIELHALTLKPTAASTIFLPETLLSPAVSKKVTVYLLGNAEPDYSFHAIELHIRVR